MNEKNNMQILSTAGWSDYELIDSGDGYRLERFGKYILSRPDPQIIWKKKLSEKIWQTADAVFQRMSEDKGQWIRKSNLPDKWLMRYKNLSFWVKLSPFKHTGVFPEQCLQWDFISSIIEARRSKLVKEARSLNLENLSSSVQHQNPASIIQFPLSSISVLNLFAYTGIASLAASEAGAKVTHVDASRPTIGWARENQEASKLIDKPIRWILDDAVKFTEREIKRGIKYDGIIMDPPIFGHGPDGKVWKFNEHFPQLLKLCRQVLSDTPLFIIINAYAISSSAIMLQNVLEDYFGNLHGIIEVGELALQEKSSKRLLSTGIFARWSTA